MANKRIIRLLNSASPLLLLGTASALLAATPAQAFDGNSLPSGGTVTGGAASIAQSGNTMTVTQSSNRAVIDWRSFDIGANAQANFAQPGVSSIAVNRVNAGTDPSRIDGGLHANGQVWILNPNGVMFGKTARVDAAGVVATTANIDDRAFMAGDNKLQMRGGDTGSVVNEGHITVGEGGLAAFVAPSVRNSGSIRARVGRVALAAGDTYTLDLAGDRLVEIGLGAGKAMVDQAGQIVNEGGTVTISAKAAGAAVDSLINMSGLTDASSVRTAGGQIILGADNIVTTADASLKADGISGGQITAVADKTGNYAGSFSAQATSGAGGQIETSAKVLHIDNGISVNTQSAQGKTGNWTLDPDALTVTAGSGGSAPNGTSDGATSTIGADTVVTALNTTDVTLQARNSITVNSAIDASGNTNAHNLALNDQDSGGLSVSLSAAIKLKAGATLTGQATSIQLANGGLIQNANDIALANTTITVGPGTYAAGAILNKDGLSLAGSAGSLIQALNNGDNGLTISANGVSVSGLEIAGPAGNTAYDAYAWGGDITRGIVVTRGATGFSITGNNIHGTRNNILVDGLGNTGSITGNTLANSKSGISVQYTDGAGINISGNTDGGNANEWGLNLHLNGHSDGVTFYSNSQKIAADANSATQAAILALSTANGGMSVQDQGYSNSNRTAVTVATTGSDANQGSSLNSLATIQAGVSAVVAGGVVNVTSGIYREQVVIAKNLTLNGGNATLESPDILAHSFLSDGINRKAVLSVEGADVAINHLTVDGRGQGAANNFFIGVGLHNASGNLSNLTVKGIRDGGVGGNIIGSQHGVGVAVYNDDGATREVNLSDSAIKDYQKNGALFTGTGLTAHVDNNTITGVGPTASIAQNGILFVGATGSIAGNEISGIGYSPDDVWATAIYLKDAAGTSVTGNTVHGAGGLTGSTLGVYAGNSAGLTISGNHFLNVEQGIDLASANATINNNQFKDSGAGIELEDTATGFSIAGNDFTNNAVQIYADFVGADLNALIGANNLDRSVINNLGATTVYGDLQTAIDKEAAGSTLNLAGTFAAGATVNKAGDTLSGHGAVINVSTHTTGLTIAADNVTVEGIEFAGNVATPYTAANWTDAAYQGVTAIAVSGNTSTGASGFNITRNDIHDVRTGIIVQGASTSGSITDNRVENTKGGILVQYNDGTPYAISGNREGTVGNEWGIVVNLNTAGINTAGAAPLSAQQNLLALANGNNGMAAMDRHYAEANRTRVVVNASGTATAADDGGYGNGLGNARQALSSIQDGVDAVVTGGEVNLTNGIYREQVVIAKDLTLNGGNATLESPDVLAHSFSSDGIDRRAVLSVEGANATISNLTVDGRGQGNANNFFIGVGLHNAGGNLSNLTVKGIRDGGVGGSISGGQHGVGVAVYNDDGHAREVTLSDSAISDYQKNGALFTGHGLTANVNNNIVTGVGPTASNAQNGILFVGATGSISGNTISGVGYSPDTVWATAIYLNDAAGTTVSGNTVNGAGGLTGSTLGVYAGGSDGVTISGNHFRNVEQGIDLASANAIISSNEFKDSGAGIELEDTATGFSIAGNDFTNNTVQIYADSAGADLNALIGTNSFDRSVVNDAGGTTIYSGLQLALNSEAAGSTLNVGMGTYNENVTVAAPVTLNFDDVTLDSLDIAAGASGTTLSGTVIAGSVTAFDITLGGDLSLDTSAAGGTIALAAVDGAHALTLNAGTGVALVGSIGATTRLGAVDIAADLIALGATNKASSFNLAGDVALSAASTLIDTTVSSTAAGGITFGGDIFGLTDGGQSLVLSAGPGTGAASANGDIVMNNGGLSTVRLGNLSVSGNDFTALTVDLAGNFNSQLTGNQLFAADTLNASGNVVSNVAGNVTGHIVAGGNVNLNSGGIISGVLVGQTVSLTAQTANAQVTASTLNVNAKSGTITGTFTPGTISNGLSLNGQVAGAGTGSTGGSTGGGATTVRFPTVKGQQLVVQNFPLPAGTQIAADGTLILPTGLVIGLLSPGGGPARVIMVNDVRSLGQLLSEGYSAIVIDLNSKKNGEVQVASN